MTIEFYTNGAGQGLGWGAAFGSEANSLASGNAVLSSIVITNGTALDIFADISIVSAITAGAPNFVSFFVYPLCADGVTYGDGRFVSAAAGPPASNYQSYDVVGNTTVNPFSGNYKGIVLPPGTFSFVIWNKTNNALANPTTIKYRTYDRT